MSPFRRYPYAMACSTLACFALIFLIDLIVHVGLLMPFYAATSEVWNSPVEMNYRQHWYPVLQFAIAFSLTVFYYCWRQKSAGLACDCRYREGAGFGGFIGLFSGMAMAGFYVYLPIPAVIPFGWFLGEIVKGIFLGLLLAATYPKPKKKSA